MGWLALACYWYPWLKPQLFPSMSLSASKGKQPWHSTKLPAAHSAQKGLSKGKRYKPLPSPNLTASAAHKPCKLFFFKLLSCSEHGNEYFDSMGRKTHRYQTAIAVGAAGSKSEVPGKWQSVVVCPRCTQSDRANTHTVVLQGIDLGPVTEAAATLPVLR